MTNRTISRKERKKKKKKIKFKVILEMPVKDAAITET